MTTTTTEKAPTLDDLADTLDQLDNDRDRSQFTNRLDRLVNSGHLADIVADALADADGPAIIVTLERDVERADLPAVVTVPWSLNRAGDTLSTSIQTDARDTVRGIVAVTDTAVAVMFAGSLPDLGKKASAATVATLMSDGIPTGTVAQVRQHAADKDGRVKFTVAEAVATSGKRGKRSAATI